MGIAGAGDGIDQFGQQRAGAGEQDVDGFHGSSFICEPQRAEKYFYLKQVSHKQSTIAGKQLEQRKNCTLRQSRKKVGAKTVKNDPVLHASLLVKLLSKCRFSRFLPYFSWSASLQGFVKLLYAGKLVYEICFFFANRTFHLLLLESFCV